jgi:hypothetical protein
MGKILELIATIGSKSGRTPKRSWSGLTVILTEAKDQPHRGEALRTRGGGLNGRVVPTTETAYRQATDPSLCSV